ncbi:hypothetical protein FN846DRAFT_910625 [Sphaerosporella brunnea]|uniref:Uncharacterized protein n=1 Tax=Sphaerosporella brunnea TaxID=1250544 RepID=A0A5J5EN05_9PEZI|nr:hypothetical protein FN846DRAFT_910625 [Sphaerosporella brunnea]
MANSLVSQGAGEIVNTGKMVRVKVATEKKLVRMKHEQILVNLWLSGHQCERWMTVIDMDEYDVILGKPWYTEMNGCHTIDYERNAIWIHARKKLNHEEAHTDETAGNKSTIPNTSWAGIKTNDDMDFINAILNKVQVVWGGGAVDRDARKKKGAFLVRLRNIQTPEEMENYAFTVGMEKDNDTQAALEQGLAEDFADVFEALKGIPIQWKDGKAVEMHIELVDDAGTPFKTPYRLSRAETEELVKVLTIALEKG